MPDKLKEDLALWADQVPQAKEFAGQDELFPPASYQYVLYGMGYNTRTNPRGVSNELEEFSQIQFESVSRNAGRLTKMLPTNRSLLDSLNAN